MKGDNAISAESTPGRGKKTIRKDIAVFAFFIFVSFVFWYFNSLGKEIEAGIKYPIKYINIPRERVLTGIQPSELNLYLKGPGYSVLKLRFSGKRAPLIIDISKVNYRRFPRDKVLDYYIITTGLSKSLNVQMRSGCEITSIKPDTIFFTLARVNPNPGVSGNKSDAKKKN